MKKRYKVLIYLFSLILIILSTFSLTWMFLEKISGDTDIYKYDVELKDELYKDKKYTYYFGPKDEQSKLISYNNAIVRKDKNNKYKLIITLNDEECTLMKNNYFFYKNYFYLISNNLTRFDLSQDKIMETKKVDNGVFIGNASVSKIYGENKGYIYFKVKLFKETDSRKWHEDRYYKVKYDNMMIYEIPQKLLPEF